MPSRRWHQKSHHGCQTCKARKVKCDETRPICKNCSKQGRPCQFTSEAAVVVPFPGASISGNSNSPHYGLIDFGAEEQQQQQSQPQQPHKTEQDPIAMQSSSAMTSPTTLKHDSSHESVKLPVIESARPSSQQQQQQHNFKIQPLERSTLLDLELMHHYTRHTYLTVSDLEYTLPMWQDTLPKEAVTHPFLMHGILSLAAFHIAVLEPAKNKAYIDRGMQHYTLALTMYREDLMNADQNNCNALFAFSSLGAIISFAVSHVSRHTHAILIQDIQDTISMLRGIHAVVMVTRHWIQHGPMSTLLRGYVARDYDLPASCLEYLQNLEKRVKTSEANEERQTSYLDAIEWGRKALKNIAYDPNDKTLAFTWPIMISRPYIDALHEKQPLAIAILGLYGVILHDVRIYWWASDRGIRLIEAVSAALDDSWEDIIRYPVSLISFTPTPRSTSQFSSSIASSTFSPPSNSPAVKFESLP